MHYWQYLFCALGVRLVLVHYESDAVAVDYAAFRHFLDDDDPEINALHRRLRRRHKDEDSAPYSHFCFRHLGPFFGFAFSQENLPRI
jgi:hypothetical protein